MKVIRGGGYGKDGSYCNAVRRITVNSGHIHLFILGLRIVMAKRNDV